MDRFIVGTGRCGSTLLSRMLAENTGLLSIFEFFNGLDIGRRFETKPVSGRDFADLISQEQPFVTWVLERGYSVPEITYPFGEGARYRPEQGLPWILVSSLPRIHEDPDALFDEVVAFARALPGRTLSLHYRALFDWLCARLGRRVWIERSGSSVEYLEALHAFFPEARFLHLHRDGREAALSMREHHAYRLAISMLFREEAEAAQSEEERAEPDPITRILESRPPVELFGRYWSQQLQRGFRALKQLRPDQYREVAFEDLVARPAETLREIGAFLELPDDGWIGRGAALVRGVPPTRFEALPPEEQRALERACGPAQQLLGRVP